MSATTVATTSISSLADPSVPSSIVSLTSARVASMSPATLSVTMVTSSDDRSTTSIVETSVRSASSTATVALSATSPTPDTSSMTISSTSTPASTSNTLSTTFFSSLPSSSSYLSSSPGRTNMPITTVSQNTTIFITITNSHGQVLTSIPPVVTEVVTTTESGGLVTTITQAVVNPTLAPNNNAAGDSSFFNNSGAVVGVFVVVGLASASMLMWILFALRQRQRMKRIEQDTAVEAAVAAAGLNRAPLDDDDDDSPITPNTRHHFAAGIGQRSRLLSLGGSGSLPTSAQFSAVLEDPIKDSDSSHPVGHRTHSHSEGYILARTASPSLRERGTDDFGSSRDRKSSYGHTPTYSAGSFEPLLANYLQNTPDQDTSAPAVQPPQNCSPQHPVSGLAPNTYSSDGSVVGSRTSSKRQNSSDSEEDYTRYALTVRNVPDDQSQHSL